jgi:hypothetical protein
MRKYIVYYYTEKNDECVDLEIEIEANNIEIALCEFRSTIKVYKRVYQIKELTNQK